MKTIEKQKIISKLVIYAGFFTGLMTLAGTAKEMKLKRDAKEAYLTSKIEYYEDLARKNNIYLKNQEQNYEAKLENFKEAAQTEFYNNIIKIDEEYQNQIKDQLKFNDTDYKKKGIITKDDLKYIKTLVLDITEESNIDFLRYCTNLEELTIYTREDNIELLNNLPVMEKLTKLSFAANIKTFGMQEAQTIIITAPNLEELILPVPMDYRNYTIERIPYLKKLTINPSNNCDINFSNLYHLESLTISSNNPYNIAIWFNSEEYENLKKVGVKVGFLSELTEKKYLEISKKIDEIIETLPITKESTDEEILNASIEYVIKNFKTKENEEINERMYLNHQHYIDGILYGALEKDTQVSGNYAGMIDAIFDRTTAPSNSYILQNEYGYMWNYVNIDGKEYYIDGKQTDDAIFEYDGKRITIEEALEKGLLKEPSLYKEPVVTYQASNNKNSAINPINGHIAINVPKDEYQISGIMIKKYEAMQEKESVEIPKLDMKLLQPSKQESDIEINETIQKYDNNIIAGSISGIMEIAVALYVLIKKKYKNQIRAIKEIIKTR